MRRPETSKGHTDKTYYALLAVSHRRLKRDPEWKMNSALKAAEKKTSTSSNIKIWEAS